MNVLAIDTATEVLGIALKTKAGEVSSFSMNMGYKHGELLVPWIERILDTASLHAHSLDLVVCASGPGSFTGLRIGIATAKGIAYGSDCPLMMVSTLDAIAYGFRFFKGTVLPVVDAKKHRYYTAMYSDSVRTSDYLDITIEEILVLLSGENQVLLTGPAAHEAYRAIDDTDRSGRILIDPACDAYNPAFLLNLGVMRYKEEGVASADTDGPLYLRKSEAEIGIIKK